MKECAISIATGLIAKESRAVFGCAVLGSENGLVFAIFISNLGAHLPKRSFSVL